MSQPGDDAMFVQPRFTKPQPKYEPHSWERVEQSADSDLWPMFRTLTREIRTRGLDRSLFGQINISGYFISMGGPPGPYDPYLCIARPQENAGDYAFEFVGSHRDPKQNWRAVYPAEQVIPAFYRFVTRAGWFPEGHPMLAGMETGVPYGQG